MKRLVWNGKAVTLKNMGEDSLFELLHDVIKELKKRGYEDVEKK